MDFHFCFPILTRTKAGSFVPIAEAELVAEISGGRDPEDWDILAIRSAFDRKVSVELNPSFVKSTKQWLLHYKRDAIETAWNEHLAETGLFRENTYEKLTVRDVL